MLKDSLFVVCENEECNYPMIVAEEIEPAIKHVDIMRCPICKEATKVTKDLTDYIHATCKSDKR